MSTAADQLPMPASLGEPSGLIRADREAVLSAWDDHCAAAGYVPGTRALYRGIAARFLDWLATAGIGLGEITPRQVDDFVEAKDVGPTTQSEYRRCIRPFLDALVARGLIEPHLTAESLSDRFEAFTPVERQATVDAAATALLFHDIHRFTEGQGGSVANVDLCEKTLQLGEQYGIIPFSWADKPSDGDGQSDQDAAAAEQSKPDVGAPTLAKEG